MPSSVQSQRTSSVQGGSSASLLPDPSKKKTVSVSPALGLTLNTAVGGVLALVPVTVTGRVVSAVKPPVSRTSMRTVWVAEVDGAVVGFVAYEMDHKSKTGEVQLLAVHPDHQNHDIGTELNTFALEKMREGGMTMAKVETGGDPSHAPARRSYEKAGYRALPLVRYFLDL